ncbi:MAG: ArsA family ATPase [Acidimicrobiales bacterium]
MDPVSFFTSARVHIVAGKGGVGKSTLVAGLGVAAASLGLDVLLIEIEGRGGLPAYFGRTGFGYQDVELGQGLRGRTIRAEDALVEYLAAARLGRVARRMLDSGLVEVISRGAPGLGDLLVLGKIKQLERGGAADVLLVDAPASGHALTLLKAPGGLLDTVRDGPIHAQAAEVVELLTDGRRCQLLLVTTLEETPINEVIETAFDLEDRVGIHLGPLLVNGVLAAPNRLPPPEIRGRRRTAGPASGAGSAGALAALERLTPALVQAAAFDQHRYDQQQRQLQRLGSQLPLVQLTVGQRPGDGLGPADVAELAEDVLAAVRTLGDGASPPAGDRVPAAATGGPAAEASSTRHRRSKRGVPADPHVPDHNGHSRRSDEQNGSDGVISALTSTAEVIVCAGAGGVGKTSVAAALALQGAYQGRRSVVLTIDPARRLADALGLGLGPMTNRTHQLTGDWLGELHVTMLDTKDTFDRLVSRYAADQAQQREILANRFYRNISQALSGTQEYMAAEQLFELHHSGRYDLVVIDTPPTRQALDFLDAPARLTRFLDHRVYRLLTGGGGTGRGSALAAQVGLGAVRTAGRVVGSAVLEDAIIFFRAFHGMQDGFRERAGELRALLAGPTTNLVVVTAPQPEALREAALFLHQLQHQDLSVAALILNRVTPGFEESLPPGVGADDVEELALRLPEHPWQPALNNLARMMTAREDQIALGRYAARRDHPLADPQALPLMVVPELDEDVHNLEGVQRLRAALVATRLSPATPQR